MAFNKLLVTEQIKKVSALLLLSVFLLAITPEEYFHAFTGHTDNVDLFHTEQQFSTKHIHCVALLLSLPSFIDTTVVCLALYHIQAAQLCAAYPSRTNYSRLMYSFGRAPPATV